MSDNVVTYVMELQDKISSKLKTIGIGTDTMLEKWSAVERTMNAANRTVKETGGSIGIDPTQ